MVMFPFCLAVCALIGTSQGVSTKMDFGDEDTSVVTNTTKVGDEDVEVKHTIVVSTKLKNNRRGIHGANDDQRTITYNTGQRQNKEKEDSGEVPIVSGYKAVETTQIRTPDTRHKTAYPEVTLESRNLRDEYDIYPNLANHPMQWKPSSFYNNINTWNQDYVSHGRSNTPYYQSKLNRRIADDTVKEFYCRRCMELGGSKGCTQRPYRATTPKMKIDGKLVKLD
ncbi:hypothetical protein O3G_MSEX013648 [Manduca sexta]|uniref:Secreted protein n=1 Tax=Manduca sexta TaxID=7130 RepID=A0A922CYT1_MANSE|nr:hypothetical protein O3G_MSEX013648 [Manduca sexta]